MRRPQRSRPLALCLLLLINCAAARGQEAAPGLVPKFPLAESGLGLERRTHPGAFLGVLGRRSGVYGYEHRQLEAWAYPLQVLDRFDLSFRLEGYPLEFRAADTAASISVRPEATVITYSHAAFTVRQVILAPLEEPGVLMLFDADSALPLSVEVSFRPRLKPMWPAAAATPNLSWDKGERAYFIWEETGRFVGVVGSPSARDVSVMPYQEEPRDVPARFRLEVPAEQLKTHFLPVVIAGSARGREEAQQAYRRLLGSARELYEKNVSHYRRLLDETTAVETPDARVNEAFAWAKVGIDKGVVSNPLLGTGLVAGFRTAGESERPGFAWFFGRDSLWTSFALNSYGDFRTTRAALDFLKKFQRADGKIPHEISQSASLVNWFDGYPYAWASADATPLYVAAHADLFRMTGDSAYLRANWDSILKAYRFTAATDTDANGLVENTAPGHGWVEGGALYPPHEEIYMQGVWVEALRGLSEMAAALGEEKLAAEASAAAERTRESVEKTYWLAEHGLYAFATSLPRKEPREADPGPNRAARQARMNELDAARLIDEDTVLPAVALWWKTLDAERAQRQIDRLGSGRVATDWGARILSDASRLYDPLSYHHGSVWPLFTGWASLGAYRYGRPHVGRQALMANVLLRKQGALGYVTELLSGDFNAPFGRSSHHQIWSEAMVVTPLLRGLLGVEPGTRGPALTFAPQLPPDWPSARVSNVAARGSLFDISLTRTSGETVIKLRRRPDTRHEGREKPAATKTARVRLAPAFPLDARIKTLKVDGRPARFSTSREGDVQRVEFELQLTQEAEARVTYDEGTDVYTSFEPPAPGARSEGLRILRSRAEPGTLRLLLEGRGARAYSLRLRTPHSPAPGEGYQLIPARPGEYLLTVHFGPPADAYVTRELSIPLAAAR